MGKEINKSLHALAGARSGYTPVILNLALAGDRRVMERLIAKGDIRHVRDDYEEQERELFGVLNPTRVYASAFEEEFQSHRRVLDRKRPDWQRGRWAYFPWSSSVTHILPDADFQLVRTARNRNLISAAEQKKFYDAVVGIGGLSVGNSVALAIVLQGGARRIRLADHDRLALSNLNRIRGGVHELGLPKVILTARQIYALNPYAKVRVFQDGLTPKNIKGFVRGLDVMIDEIDNLAVKCLIREEARRQRVPVVMGADNGDNAVIDIERYDLDPKTPFFHGRMGRVSYGALLKLDKFGIGKLITKHIGAETVTERMQKSLLEMGKTIVSWPQLGGAALLNGSGVAYCVRKIVNGQPLEGNRALLSLDEKLVPGYDKPSSRKHRARTAREFRKIFGL